MDRAKVSIFMIYGTLYGNDDVNGNGKMQFNNSVTVTVTGATVTVKFAMCVGLGTWARSPSLQQWQG